MKMNHISPLTFSIMTEACKNVKGRGEVSETPTQTPSLESLMESKMFCDIAWEKLSQEGLRPSGHRFSSWSDPTPPKGVVVCSCQNALTKLEHEATISTVVLLCNLDKEECFQIVNQIKEKEIDVWIYCSKETTNGREYFFEDKKLQRSSQLGFGWYLDGRTSEEWIDLFDCSLPAWRFWFKNEQSRQWVWPFCDIVYQRLCEEYKLSSPPKSWIKDFRQRSSWVKLEEKVYAHFVAVMGGEAIVSALMQKVASLK